MNEGTTNEGTTNEGTTNEGTMNEGTTNEGTASEDTSSDEVEMVPFWTPGERQALAAALDREALVDRVFEGRNIPAYHMVPPGYPYATEPFLDK
ncbi:MAG: ABC transporter substrate-binding protein [Anaerolineales bacterium]